MKVLVTGGSGFLGGHLVKALRAAGHTVLTLSSKDCNLREPNALNIFSSEKFDRIYHLAAWTQAGDFCLTHAGEQWIINQQMNTNALTWWKEKQPQAKLIAIGSSCCYEPGSPHIEENFLRGLPTESLLTYAMTKRMLYSGLVALNKQFGLKYLFVVPSTLYGADYHLDGRQMHFIFDLMRKIVEGKQLGTPVVLWGDGMQKRELIHVRDFVDVMLQLSDTLDNEIVNIGGGVEYPIRHFAALLSEIVGYDAGKIQYDTSRYVGAQSKVLEVGKLAKLLPSFQRTDLESGLREIVKWYIDRTGVGAAASRTRSASYLDAAEKKIEQGELNDARLLLEKAAQSEPESPRLSELKALLGSNQPSTVSCEQQLREKVAAPGFQPFCIDQFVTSFAYGDAVGNCLRLVRRILREWGLPSNIFTEGADPRLQGEWYWYQQHQAISGPRNICLYHPSDGRSAIIPYLRAIPDRKILYYHNITPSEFFEPWDKNTAEICRTARAAVAAMADVIPLAICDSRYNSEDLQKQGYRPGHVLPLPFFSSDYAAVTADAEITSALSDGKKNILFVGRVAPNKCQHDLILAYQRFRESFDSKSRLIIAGAANGSEAYTAHLRNLCSELRLDDVIITGHITSEQLVAYYQAASAFLCLSEHEGFCIPLLEAMHYRVPILAFHGSAVGETLGGCSPMIETKDPNAIAKELHRIVSDAPGRQQIVERQLERLQNYTEARYRERLAQFLLPLMEP